MFNQWTLLIVVVTGRDEETKNSQKVIIGKGRDGMDEKLSFSSGQVEI